jgi:S-(hydroxymethyl)mycothiol dehydrogenase
MTQQVREVVADSALLVVQVRVADTAGENIHQHLPRTRIRHQYGLQRNRGILLPDDDCFNTANATQKMTLEDGTKLSPALGIGAFAEKTLVAAGQCTKVDPETDAAAVGLLGCGVMAGIGAAINTGEVKRGESVAVIGCGGVGIAAIAGAKLAGATTIIAVDIDDNKIEMGKSLGATHGVNSRQEDAVEAIRALTGGNGADVVIDAVGRPETYKQAFYARDLAGRVMLVGVPTPDMLLELPLLDVFGRGGP